MRTLTKTEYAKQRRTAKLSPAFSYIPVPAGVLYALHVSDLSAQWRLHSDRLVGTCTRFRALHKAGESIPSISTCIYYKRYMGENASYSIHKICIQKS